MISNLSTIDNNLIAKAILALNLGHYNIEIQEKNDLINPLTDEEIFGETEYMVHMGYASISINASLSTSSKELTLLHELCHVSDRDCETIWETLKVPNSIKELFFIYHEKAIENYARALYLLIRGEEYDGLQDFRELVKDDGDTI